MKIYRVGGSVRDQLLGRAQTDQDYVVVGSTPDAMIAAGFKPVGADFPVFLHPETHAEYALARTERKVAPGYTGFTFHTDASVTLADDLSRRDFTINAMAMDNAGVLIDPFGGARDLAAGVLRHVGPAFAEDPVRILRGARFAARLGFALAPETRQLMRQMVAAGEADHLVAERVWQELSRGLMEAQPARMIEVLRDAGALKVILPELDRLWGVPQPAQYHPEIDTGIHTMMVLSQTAAAGASLPIRFACLVHDLGKGTTPADILPSHRGHEARGVELIIAVCERLRVPNDCRDLAVLVAREHSLVHGALSLKPATIHDLFQRADAFRRPERFADALKACEHDARGRQGLADRHYPQPEYLSQALAAARGVDAGAIVATVQARAAMASAKMADLAGAIRLARIEAIREVAQKYAATH
jgi:tRNA nucleotidyltransferase (CCA-adding enzyme)